MGDYAGATSLFSPPSNCSPVPFLGSQGLAMQDELDKAQSQQQQQSQNEGPPSGVSSGIDVPTKSEARAKEGSEVADSIVASLVTAAAGVDKESPQQTLMGGFGASVVSDSGSRVGPSLWDEAGAPGHPVNGGAFQNFPSGSPASTLFSSGSSTRRAITASHNFPQQAQQAQQQQQPVSPNSAPGSRHSQLQQGNHPQGVYLQGKSYAAWSGGGAAAAHQSSISPIKFRRSTSYPGKNSMYPIQPAPTFELTAADERDLLQMPPYQQVSWSTLKV
ncbi:hypothetical protein QAD02_019597 [Eretmocerus hayati]|uniref:Uncharacterized protein n=1 Tax=Eretmocerus hayati TaxID=131215 RepID=A0ACC2PPU9_9HYME|nr:hypothetical protein QAD02_019597 [Eretmocerus hayati]